MTKEDRDRLWLGGYLSGNGCLRYIKRHGGKRVYTSLCLHSTDLECLKEVQRIIGLGGYLDGPREPSKRAMGRIEGKRYTWRLEYCGSAVTEFMRGLLPVMRGPQVAKMEQILKEVSLVEARKG
jgi:hypothetical protein